MTFEHAPRRHRPLTNLGLALFSILLTFGLLEVGLRLFVGRVSWTQPDDVIGWSFIPGASYKFVAPEGCPGWGSSGRINSHGLRDYEYGYAKPPGTFRILALGDSYTEAFQFELDRTWTKLLEQALNAQEDGWRYQVINAGRSGMGTTHEYLFYQDKGYKYHADLVLLLFIENDFQDNSKKLAPSIASGPYFVLEKDELVLDNTFRDSLNYRLYQLATPVKKISFLVSYMMRAFTQMRAAQASRSAGVDAGGQPSDAEGLPLDAGEQPLLDAGGQPSDAGAPPPYMQGLSPSWTEAIAITQQVLIRLNEAVVANGASLVVVNGVSSQVHLAKVSRTHNEHPDCVPDRPQTCIQRVTSVHDIPFLDLVPVFHEQASPRGVFFHGCVENNGLGHWNAEGHALAASTIYGFLIEHGLLKPTPERR